MIIFGKETDAANGWTNQEARLGNLTIHLGRSPKANPLSAEFLPNKVSRDREILWRFDKSYVGCIAYLREVDGEWLIVYASRREVADIIPIADLPAATLLSSGQYDWARPALERLALKLAAAKLMNLEPRLSAAEGVMKSHLDRQIADTAAAAAEALRAERQEQFQTRKNEREARRRAIRLRSPLTVYTAAGEKKRGYPVVGDEWQCLGQGVDCVSVDSYEAGIPGEVREHFFVNIRGSNKEKARITSVFATDPTKPKPIEKMGEIVVLIDGKPDVVACYTRDGLRALEKGGLNSGAVRAVWPARPDGSYTLVSFRKGGMKDLKSVQPLSC